jgi:ankyrin repeat protein
MNMNPDPKDNAGYTPLHEACSRGHLEIARLLLRYGASHAESALSGIRPLHEAIENGHIEMVRLLLSFGADPCLATYSGQMPITMAEDKEMEMFLNSYLIDVGHKDGAKSSWLVDGAFKFEGEFCVTLGAFKN